MGDVGPGFGGQVADADGAGCHDAGVHPAKPKLAAETGVDKAHCLGAKTLKELHTAQMWGIADLQHGLANREEAACWEVVVAEVKVEVKLITGQRHSVGSTGDKLSDPRVHHRYLPVRVR